METFEDFFSDDEINVSRIIPPSIDDFFANLSALPYHALKAWIVAMVKGYNFSPKIPIGLESTLELLDWLNDGLIERKRIATVKLTHINFINIIKESLTYLDPLESNADYDAMLSIIQFFKEHNAYANIQSNNNNSSIYGIITDLVKRKRMYNVDLEARNLHYTLINLFSTISTSSDAEFEDILKHNWNEHLEYWSDCTNDDYLNHRGRTYFAYVYLDYFLSRSMNQLQNKFIIIDECVWSLHENVDNNLNDKILYNIAYSLYEQFFIDIAFANRFIRILYCIYFDNIIAYKFDYNPTYRKITQSLLSIIEDSEDDLTGVNLSPLVEIVNNKIVNYLAMMFDPFDEDLLINIKDNRSERYKNLFTINEGSNISNIEITSELYNNLISELCAEYQE